jgi:hypothetical protein
MFTVGNYQISFKKSKNLDVRPNNNYDTICRICSSSSNKTPFSATAFLHPNDKYDKIIGKKIALTKAISMMNISKDERTSIWKAFWSWVESWKKKEKTYRKIYNYNINTTDEEILRGFENWNKKYYQETDGFEAIAYPERRIVWKAALNWLLKQT